MLFVQRTVAAHREASRIISSSTAWSAATGAIPVPLLDVAALAAMQASMIGKIAALYGETLGSQAARSIVSVLLGTLLPAGLAVGVMRSTISSCRGPATSSERRR